MRNGGADVDAEISGVISNRSAANVGSILKSGEGTLNFSAVNTYTGSTTVSAGTLLVSGALATASAVTVASRKREIFYDHLLCCSKHFSSCRSVLQVGMHS